MLTLIVLRQSVAAAVLSCASAAACNQADSDSASLPASVGGFQVETMVSGLNTPWDLAWGPDGAIWFSERPGTISRLDPTTKQVTRVAQISTVVSVGESGLMGL